MIKNYIKTSFRYLSRHKVFTGINLTGLSTGMCVCFFALLYVDFELSYDNYQEKADSIYRLVTDEKTPTGTTFESASAAMGPALVAEFPEVISATRVFLDDYIIQKDEQSYGTVAVAYADSSLFSLFNLPLISGTPESVFNAPFNMVLSETVALKYFGSTDCVGKTLTLNGNQTAAVTGVMNDIPHNSHFRTDILLSMSSLIGTEPSSNWLQNWNRYGFYTYLLLANDQDPGKLSSKLPAFIKKHNQHDGIKQSLSLEPLKQVYLEGKGRGGKAGSTSTGNRTNVYIFSVISALVMFIACFNFVNLTTAFSLQRAKEIGVRKVMGASKKQLIIQFLTDAIILSLFAFLISLLLCVILLPLFNQLSGKIISTDLSEHAGYIGLLFLTAIVVGLLSGIYPAFFLSSFHPGSTLQGRFMSGIKGTALRKSLVVTQFSISMILIIATIVIYEQLDFMKNTELGFKKDHTLVIDFQYDQRILDHEESVKQQLSDIPGVDMASFSSYIPGKPNKKFQTKIENVNNEMQEFQSDAYFIDYDFLKQYQIEIIAGRPLSKEYATDFRSSMLINEAAVKRLGFSRPADVIGKRFSQATKGADGVIVGVIKDFHFHSMLEEVQPLTLRVSPGFFTFISLTVSSQNMESTINSVEKKWRTLAPGLPFSYFFADEVYNAQYASQDRFGRLIICFATLAILISCLGLMGLSAFSTAQRTKEIGIRKILGSGVTSIIKLLIWEFLKPVFVACLIAFPIAAWTMNTWLENFAYRIDLGWEMFAIAGIAGLCLACATVGIQSFRAAACNPLKSLRTD